MPSSEIFLRGPFFIEGFLLTVTIFFVAMSLQTTKYIITSDSMEQS